MGGKIGELSLGLRTALTMVFVAGLAASVSLLPASYAQSHNSVQSSSQYSSSSRAASRAKASVLSGHVLVNKYSAAESAVQLLDNIFSRVSNIPQVAHANQSQMLAQSQRLQKKEGVDYRLAIRPKETGKAFTNLSPSLQIVGQADKGPLLAFDQAQRGGASFAQQVSAPQPAPVSISSPNASEPGSFARGVENWRGSARTNASGLDGANRPGVWDANDSIARRDADSLSVQSSNLPPTNMGKFVHQSNAGSKLRQSAVNVYNVADDAKKRMPELASSLNRLYGLNKTLEEAQDAGEMARNYPAAAPAPSPILQIASSEKKKQSFYNAPRDVQIMDERPVLKDYRESPRQESLASAAAGRAGVSANYAGGGAGANAPVSGSLLRKAESSNETKRSRESMAKNKERDAQKANRESEKAEKELSYADSYAEGKRDMLALLPPHVATGIPLVSLGSSHVQAMNALSNVGEVKEQKIGKWTVLTWKKRDSGNVALQLFFRHGLLDAIRIFDSSLIAPDFGAAPGATLESVKERFGEPAFLLPEPNPGIGQNYVYPISQVGFQFARREKESAPQVVSVLIFSVK